MCLEKAFRSATCGFWQPISLAVSPATSFLFSASGMRPKRIAGGQNWGSGQQGDPRRCIQRGSSLFCHCRQTGLLENTCSYTTQCFSRLQFLQH